SLAVVTAVCGYLFVWSGFLDYLSADRFEEVPCVVTSASSGSTGRARPRWKMDLAYEYQVDDRHFTATRYGFVNGTTFRSPADMPPLPRVGPGTCFVRRGRPGVAVLRKYIDPY